ncbi:hypothetical protein [Nocardia sp. NPDC050710]|uniref:hypothetical protein n=1 Tax=Nocardia sp. NPDC050710 TaxID=3157220 RepID=UPI0033D0D546
MSDEIVFRDDDANQVACDEGTGHAPDYASMRRSAVVRELAQLPARTRLLIGPGPMTLRVLDALVAAAYVVTDPTDPRPVGERFDWFEQAVGDDMETAAALEEFATWMNSVLEDQIHRWTRQFKTETWKKVMRRLVGAKAYDKLAAAILEDATVVGELLLWVSAWVRPYAVALDDCVALLTPAQLKELGKTGLTGPTAALRAVLTIDAALHKAIDLRFDFDAMELQATETGDGIDLSRLIEEFRPLVTGPTRASLEELSSAMGRKLKGARFALDSSEDGVSQAAHSLVELIDRLLRTAFPEADVLEWLAATNRSGNDYLITRGPSAGKPTKRAQALCVAYGAQVVAASPFHEAAAAGLIVVRTNAQKLKHADTEDPTEAVLLRQLISSVEGFLMLAIRLGWSGLDAQKVAEIRARFAA